MYHPIRFSRRFIEAWKTVNIRRNCIYLTMSFFFHLFSPLRNQPRFLARFRNLADGLKSWTLKFLSSLWVLSYKYYEASLEYHRTPYRHVQFFLVSKQHTLLFNNTSIIFTGTTVYNETPQFLHMVHTYVMENCNKQVNFSHFSLFQKRARLSVVFLLIVKNCLECVIKDNGCI